MHPKALHASKRLYEKAFFVFPSNILSLPFFCIWARAMRQFCPPKYPLEHTALSLVQGGWRKERKMLNSFKGHFCVIFAKGRDSLPPFFIFFYFLFRISSPSRVSLFMEKRKKKKDRNTGTKRIVREAPGHTHSLFSFFSLPRSPSSPSRQ